MAEAFIKQVQTGNSIDRVDGRLKVTGGATYAAEYKVPSVAHAVLVTSTIARGKIKSIDAKQAEKAPGTLAVMSHLDSPGIPGYGTPKQQAERAALGTALRAFYDEHIYFSGQPVAVVVADTLERATYAAGMVKVQYETEEHGTNLKDNLQEAKLPANVARNKNSTYHDYVRGNPEAITAAEVKLAETYTIPTQHHHPLEPHALIAVWEAEDKVTVYDKTQLVKGTQGNIAWAFNLPQENVQVNARFIGGAFGSAIRVWPHVMIAIMAAKKVKRPVKLVLRREMMFTSVGSRPYTIQKLAIGATRAGKLTALSHEGILQTSAYEEHLERTIMATRILYACPNVTTRYRLVNLDVSTPTWMRGPGDATGVYALESAMDEMAYALRMDPLEFRLRNYADTDLEKNLPWSSKLLEDCYAKGAAKFGWGKRKIEPRSMQDGKMLVGYGMASSIYGYHRNAAKAKATLLANGSFILQSATSDIGPGTGTAMVVIASEALGVSTAKIRFDLGNSSLPDAPGQSGSTTISSVGSAVHVACKALRHKVIELALALPDAPFSKAAPAELAVEDGRIFHAANPAAGITYAAVLERYGLPQVEVLEESKPGTEGQKHSMYSFGAHFAEVHVSALTGEVRVKRMVTCADVGKIINYKTAHSQSIGGVIGGIGMALMEGSVMDHRYGRYVTNDLANYHVPVHADSPQIEVLYMDVEDPHVNPIGAKGLGEIAIVGVAAAVANAVFHATGKRIRELPITPDKLI